MLLRIILVIALAQEQVLGAALGLLASDESLSSPPYLSSTLTLPYTNYLHLSHLHHSVGHTSSRPRGVRPVRLTRPLPPPDPRPPPRPHPYSLLYLHYVPLSQLLQG
ncbi:hypothetical protein Pcinc_041845 [Petrolisthes cinctipes]|uniref:Secreted protein n=1 Tax=Petrolisthes cinctipes TaxID=88211 RepID=A0AAE1BJ24_PETCI|nr:hypothetical protein Pcinc_041845 [Petrolisthes cinctipes]